MGSGEAQADIRVTRLFVYPVKSCRAVPVTSAGIVRRGFEHDRRFMVIDWNGRFVTGREQPRLALVAPIVDGGQLVLSGPGMPTLRIPRETRSGERRQVEVWDDHCDAVVDVEGSAWFGDYLGGPFSLVYMPEDGARAADARHAGPDDLIGFSDAFPFLLISEGSLSDLNGRLEKPAEMERFRPNIVVAGCAPYAEDGWRRLRIGDVPMRGPKRCSRCVFTTVDPATAEQGREPLRTLAGYRTVDGKVYFGVNLLHEGRGRIQVGDALTVI